MAADSIPTCGWSRKDGKQIVPCGENAIAVYQVYAVPMSDFLSGGAPTPQALLVCRDHLPREEAVHVP